MEDRSTVSRAEQAVSMVAPAGSPRTSRLRMVPAAVGLGVALVVAGCSAGQFTQTDQQVAAVNGAFGQTKDGAIALREAELAFPSEKYYTAGTDAPLKVTIVNQGTKADKLVKVSAAGAGEVKISGSTDLPAGFALNGKVLERAATPKSSTPGSTTGAPSSTTGAGATTTPSASGQSSAPVRPTTSAAASTGTLSVSTVELVVTALGKDLRPGQTIPVTFTFQNAGQVTLQVPIANDGDARPPVTGGAGHGGGEQHGETKPSGDGH
ncbi:hypothetical protein NLX83_11900 [Allokutzneria sp. A3M-2-11 16]|uniref:hypothetical protein n=1 Tax=Allokutzneria sp. A3M-2-11 16 TaxID=2962043 RepID=UPI0020B7C0D9|nr:hypothetical protein [Allokutzneria sp. A3M-2-11 16]MCP3799959.1 hypothetical protein [Allokutzneria sp. A3M-2-11 16]